MKHYVPLVLLVSLLIVSCSPSSEQMTLPEGDQIVRGQLERAELSLYRRGTHVLALEDGSEYFVESPATDLQRYTGTGVLLRGRLEYNTDPSFSPVLVVAEVLAPVIAPNDRDGLSGTGATEPTETGSTLPGAPGTPCGGTAGILCPAGQYCAITDFEENIGRCRAIQGQGAGITGQGTRSP